MKSNLLKTLRLALGAVAAFLILPGSASAVSCGPDVTASFQVTLGAQVVQNGQVQQVASIKNLGVALRGPIYLVVENLPAGVTEYPFTWTSNCEPGALFIRIYLGYDNHWYSGATKNLQMNFSANSIPVSYTYRVIQGTGLASPHAVPGDFDGDKMADVATFNSSTGVWTILQSSSNTVTSRQFGTANLDHFVIGDFDGDLKDDYALYRPSNSQWYIIRSSDNGFMYFQLGAPNIEKPVPADYDGDGYTDIATFNPNTAVFTVRRSSDGQIVTKQFGVPGDIPVVADYDQDGRDDFAVFNASGYKFTFEHSNSWNHPLYTMSFSYFTGIPFAADFNHDGMADMCTYDPLSGRVTIVYTGTNTFTTVMLGGGNAVPVAADFSGDHQTDFAVYDKPTAHWAINSKMTTPGRSRSCPWPLAMPLTTSPS